MVVVRHKGSFKNIERFLRKARPDTIVNVLSQFGNDGVRVLAANTPVDSGKTASSWDYEIVEERGSIKIIWTNSNVVNGIPIVILLQMGHGTRNGGYVQGRDFINPALRPIFDKISDQAWKAVNG